VIALTARSGKEDRQRCLDAGMDDYLSKPLRAGDLFAAIDRVVAGSRTAQQTATVATVEQTELLDPTVLMAACGGFKALLDEMCHNFTSTAPGLVAALRLALCQRQAKQLQEAAHRLFGTITTFSTVAGEVVSEIEDRAGAGQLDEAEPLVRRLEAMVEELIRQVAGLSLDALLARMKDEG
jgi:response regulator RpfG family c-di-GMP phosphodiesterase